MHGGQLAEIHHSLLSPKFSFYPIWNQTKCLASVLQRIREANGKEEKTLVFNICYLCYCNQYPSVILILCFIRPRPAEMLGSSRNKYCHQVMLQQRTPAAVLYWSAFFTLSVFCCRHIQDPASQRLTWNKPPVNVLVIRKIRDESLVEPFKELCRFLVEVRLV